MFFKRIEMTGFKSFATKTVVDFKPGVTVVVGPNGCGKSNIFDAIRWVLGEQSAKSLRGSKMGDVIFNGSATYKPMGCAQITLVLNNEGRRLPIDFSEVSITRRLYRSGESEYQINKSPCRLRDIQELFLDTGVGTDSYSIMEQGRVGDIIKSRPEDRRLLFEEAAGISKYKIRKAEALRKLERTEGDLVRLADRINETRNRRNALKRQAAKAQRYKELRDAADLTEKKLLALDLARINETLEAVEKEYSEAQDALAVVRAQNDSVQARREELQLQMQIADETLRDLSMAKQDQQQYINQIAHEITRLKSQAEGERRRADDMNRQLTDLARRHDEFSFNLAEAKIEETRLTARSIALQAKQNTRRAQFERLRSDSASTRDQITSLRKKIEQSSEEAMRLRNERSRLQFQIEMANKAVEEFNLEKAEYEQELERLTNQIDESRGRLDRRGNDLKALQTRFDQTRQEAIDAARAREVLQGEHRKAERELHESASRLSALERLAKDYAGYFEGVKAIMLASENHLLDGVIGVVPELIQATDSSNDLAIEVALGNHVQNVVMRSAQDSKRAIQYLRTENKGQATFLPLDLLQTRELGDNLQKVLYRPGVVGLASKLVSYDRYIERSVEFLLGRTIITENIDVTLQLMREGMRTRYVTLDGQLTSPEGVMTGGSNRGRSQIITRQREITDLGQSVRELEEKEKDLAQRITKRETAMVDLQAKGEQIRNQIAELRLELGNGETQLAGLRETRDERLRRYEDLKSKAESSETTTEAHIQSLEACDKTLEALEAFLETQRGEMALMEEAVYERNSEVDRMNAHVNEADKEILRLDQQREHLRERATSFAAERQSVNRSDAAIRLEQQRSREEADRFDEQAQRIVEEKSELENELATVAEQCAEAAREKEAALQAMRAEGDHSQRLMSELTRATNRYEEAQASHLNIQSDLKRLHERANDRFERNLNELASEVGEVEESRTDLSKELQHLRVELNRMGDNINLGALVEYQETEERYQFLTAQEKDLMDARDSLRETITTIDKTSSKLFGEAFEQIRQNFMVVYRQLFGGGKADLHLLEVEDGNSLLDGGIEIVCQPPGKKLQNITLLSGGEQALTAVSLMFAIFLYKPSPFCIMDEIDAPLDDNNVLRFRNMLREFAKGTQFIIVTHNKITMELADTIYGVTMQETGVSSLVSVAFEQVDNLPAAQTAS
jgi:chromosome segregation protein